MTCHSVTEAIEAFAQGEIVIVTDDDDRENEGDLIVAASLCTTEKMAFIIRNTCGIVCAPLTGAEARRLRLDPMVAANDAPLGTAFTVTVDVKHGLTTGISAEQRTNTVRALANGNMGAADFVRPGHVFPLIARGWRRAHALRPHRGGRRSVQARGPAAGGRDLRTRQRRRHGDARRSDRRVREAAWPEAHLGRRSHRLSPIPREARRAHRDFPGGDAMGILHGLFLCDAVRHRAACGSRARPHRRRKRYSGAAAPRRIPSPTSSRAARRSMRR